MLDPVHSPSTRLSPRGLGEDPEPRVPTEGARSGTSAPWRKAIAGKVKVAEAWVHAADFRKPVASRPSSKATSTFRKKGSGDKQAKGQDDPIKTFNTFGSLEDDTGMEVEASQMSLPSSLSGGTSPPKQWLILYSGMCLTSGQILKS